MGRQKSLLGIKPPRLWGRGQRKQNGRKARFYTTVNRVGFWGDVKCSDWPRTRCPCPRWADGGRFPISWNLAYESCFLVTRKAPVYQPEASVWGAVSSTSPLGGCFDIYPLGNYKLILISLRKTNKNWSCGQSQNHLGHSRNVDRTWMPT